MAEPTNDEKTAQLIDEIVQKSQKLQSQDREEARRNIIATAEKLITHLETPFEQLARTCWGEPTKKVALRTVFEAGVFKKLGSEPTNSTQLVEGTEVDPKLIGR